MVSDIFSKHNCSLLSTEYKNQKTPMSFKCECGKISLISFRTFLYSHKCKDCTKKKVGDVGRLDYFYIKKFFKDHKCELLSLTYENVWESLKFKCCCGRVGLKSFYLFRNSPKCRDCISKESSTRQVPSYKFVSNFFADHDCVLLSKQYKNNRTKLKYICVCGNISCIAFSDFIRGSRCKQCGIEKMSGCNNPNWEPDREKLKRNKQFRIKIRNVLRCCLRTIGVKKNNKTEKLLGYTYMDLMNHITSFENWKEVSRKSWHIDHIFPIKAFLDNNIKDIRIINCLENLRPLSSHENLKKNDKYNKNEFKKWLSIKCKEHI